MIPKLKSRVQKASQQQQKQQPAAAKPSKGGKGRNKKR